MNTYYKYVPNVFLAKCEAQHEKESIITLTTKYGQEHDCIVFNLIFEKEGFYYYSIVRADGFDSRAHAKRKAERIGGWASNAENKSAEYFEASKEGRDFLALAEPIKIGHHSEGRHRALIERNHKRMEKCVEASDKADNYARRAAYWAKKVNVINLSMPECLEFYEFELEKAVEQHEGIKSGAIPKAHSYSLTYAKKARNEAEKKVILSKKLWG